MTDESATEKLSRAFAILENAASSGACYSCAQYRERLRTLMRENADMMAEISMLKAEVRPSLSPPLPEQASRQPRLMFVVVTFYPDCRSAC
jgi:hypothetical protein